MITHSTSSVQARRPITERRYMSVSTLETVIAVFGVKYFAERYDALRARGILIIIV